jgi:hypothetical protein
MPNSRNTNPRLSGHEIGLVKIVGFYTKLKKILDSDNGEPRVFYTRIPDLEKGAPAFKLTSKIFVRYNPRRHHYIVGFKLPDNELGTIFIVNNSDEIIRYDDSVDPLGYLKGVEIDGSNRYVVKQVTPENIEGYIENEIEKIIGELEICAVESEATTKRKDGPNSRSH